MPRYIDEKDVYKLVEPTGTARVHCSQIDGLPRADVVPKSEVDLYRKQVDELEDELAQTYDKLETAKAEVAREIFEEMEKLSHRFMNDKLYIFADMMLDIAELKKKYTEGQK